LEQRKKLRTRFLQLHHAHALGLFWPVTRHGRFQSSSDQPGDSQRDNQADHESARFEPAEQQRANSDGNKERPPNHGIAQPRHEQVEQWTRPLLVNEVKKRLVHANSDQSDLSFTRQASNKQTRFKDEARTGFATLNRESLNR